MTNTEEQDEEQGEEEQEDGKKEKKEGKQKGKRKNFALICVASVCMYTALSAVSNLQSSINGDQDVGLRSLAISSAGSMVACLFFTTPVAFIFGFKWSIVLGQVGIIVFIAANMYPKAVLMFPAAAICGIFEACMLTAQDAYITMLSTNDDQNDDSNGKVEKYFSISLATVQTAQIWGNLVSYLVLRNIQQSAITDTTKCGADFLTSEHESDNDTGSASSMTIIILCGIFIGIIFGSIVLVIVFLNQKREEKEDNSNGLIRRSLDYTVSTFKQMINPNQLLLAPLAFWSGAPEAFITGTYTDSFITCTIGIQYIGLIMLIYGIVSTICCIVVAYTVQLKYSRPVSFLLSSLLMYTMFIVMLVWKPNPSQTYVLYILPCLSGISDALTAPFITALYGNVFKNEKEMAFSMYTFIQYVAYIIIYLYSSALRVRVSIILQIVYLSIAMISYTILEIRQHRTPKNDDAKSTVLTNIVMVGINEISSDKY